MRNFVTLSEQEKEEFLCSFNDVFCDLDGVVWRSYQPIPGAVDCLLWLRNLGKNVRYVSNNCTRSLSFFASYLEAKGYKPVSPEDFCNPTAAIVHYLNKNNFRKKLYVIGSTALKTDLGNGGFSVADEPQNQVLKDVSHFVATTTEDDENIGAVVYDFDVNLSLVKLQKALTYLKRKDCLFICGSTDKIVPVNQSDEIMWNYHFQEILKDFSNRNPHHLSKPSMDFKEYLFEKFSITNPQKCLYIGDSLNEDIQFANKCGFQNLLVLTGVTKYEDLQDWTFSEEYKPEYYVENLEVFKNIISQTLSAKI